MWFSLAAAQGHSNAGKSREGVAALQPERRPRPHLGPPAGHEFAFGRFYAEGP
jgi:hypothetical protein